MKLPPFPRILIEAGATALPCGFRFYPYRDRVRHQRTCEHTYCKWCRRRFLAMAAIVCKGMKVVQQ